MSDIIDMLTRAGLLEKARPATRSKKRQHRPRRRLVVRLKTRRPRRFDGVDNLSGRSATEQMEADLPDSYDPIIDSPSEM